MNLIIDFVKRVEINPPLYLEEYSLTKLYHQLLGISWAANALNTTVNYCNPLSGFDRYIRKIYNDSCSWDYSKIILYNSKNEKEALNNFFKHFDEYIRIPAYRKNALYLRFSGYLNSDERDFQNFIFNLSYLKNYTSGFDNGLTEKEMYTLFLQYLNEKYNVTDAKNWHIEFLEKFHSEDKAFDEIFRILTEFLKITIGEDRYTD